MSRFGRSLRVGDDASTTYNGGRRATRVRIVERDDTRKHGQSQSGIMFRVTPPLKGGNADTWYDADWFDPYE